MKLALILCRGVFAWPLWAPKDQPSPRYGWACELRSCTWPYFWWVRGTSCSTCPCSPVNKVSWSREFSLYLCIDGKNLEWIMCWGLIIVIIFVEETIICWHTVDIDLYYSANFHIGICLCSKYVQWKKCNALFVK